MPYQQTIDFSHAENNSFSESLQEANLEAIGGQCLRVWDLLKEGKRLTVRDAVLFYGINSLPRRIKDIQDKLGVTIKREVIDKKYVEYFI